MTETYKILLKEHIMHALIDPQVGTLKDFMHQLIKQNEEAREEITKAYQQINEELVGAINEELVGALNA